jgi:hypothetical protein
MKKQTMVEGALKVAKDAFHSREMGIVHMEVDLLDRVVDVMLGEGEVLESPDQPVVCSRVADRGTYVGGDLGLSVEQLKDILSILSLVQEEAIGLLLH